MMVDGRGFACLYKSSPVLWNLFAAGGIAINQSKYVDTNSLDFFKLMDNFVAAIYALISTQWQKDNLMVLAHDAKKLLNRSYVSNAFDEQDLGEPQVAVTRIAERAEKF